MTGAAAAVLSFLFSLISDKRSLRSRVETWTDGTVIALL